MLERFVMLKNCILKSLIDNNSTIDLEEWEICRLSDIVNSLECLKITVDALCRRDANLLTADAALEFCLSNLQQQNTSISLELADALSSRIFERRTELSSLLQYLHSGKNTTESDNQNVFCPTSKTKIASILKDLVTRLHPNASSSTLEEEELSEIQSDLSNKKEKIDVQLQLQRALQNVESRAHTEKLQPSRNVLSTIKKEMGMFEAGGSRGYHLQLIHDHLKSISPTSVESERVFSSAGYFCSKIRSRMNDDTLSDLILTRSYFRFSKD